MHLLADELERLRDGDDVIHAGRDLQGFDLVPAPATDGGHDGALGAASDVRIVSGFANSIDHVRDLFLRCFLRHVDDHGLGSPLDSIGKQKPRSVDRGWQLSLFEVAVRGSSFLQAALQPHAR